MTMFAKITLVFAMVLFVKAGPLPEPQFGFGWPFPSPPKMFDFDDIMGHHSRAHSVAAASSGGLLDFSDMMGMGSLASANGDGMKGIACSSQSSPDGKIVTCMYTTEDGKVVKKIITE